MQLKVNGAWKKMPQERLSVEDLLLLGNVESPQLVSVQVNGTFVDRNSYATTLLGEDDDVDFLYYLGGGR